MYPNENPTGNGDSIIRMIQIFFNSYIDQIAANQNLNMEQFYPSSHDGIYSEYDLISILEAGDVVCVGRSAIHINREQGNHRETTSTGHFYIISGYMKINGINYFIALNSASPNIESQNSTNTPTDDVQTSSDVDYRQGLVELFSYDKLVCGTNALAGEAPDGSFWNLTIVRINEYYASTIIPPYYN